MEAVENIKETKNYRFHKRRSLAEKGEREAAGAHKYRAHGQKNTAHESYRQDIIIIKRRPVPGGY